MHRPGDVVPGEPRVAGVADQPCQLLQEERVAAGAGSGACGQRLVRLPAEAYGEQVARRLVGQTGQSEALGGGRTRQSGQHRTEGARGFGVLDAVRAQQHQREVVSPSGHRRQERQARLVRPVQVLQHDQQVPRPAGLVGEEVGHRVVQRRLREARAVGRPHHDAGRTVAGDAREVAEDLGPRPVRRAVARLVRLADGDCRSGRPGPRDHLLHESGLADACLARHHPDRTVAARAPAYGPVEDVDLCVPAQQRVVLGPAVGVGAHRGAVDDARGTRRRPVQSRVLLQELGVQPPQRGAGIDAHVVGELLAECLVGGERIGLATAAVERQQAQGVQALAQRLTGEQVLGGRGCVRRATDSEQRLHPGLLGPQHEVGEPLRLRGGHGSECVDHVAQRLAGHQGQAFVEELEGGRRVARHPGAGGLGQSGESPRVERTLRELEHVAGRPTPHPHRRWCGRVAAGGVAEGSAQAGHAHLQRGQRGLGRRVAPQLRDQPVDGHHPAGIRRQQPEQSALQRRRDATRSALDRRRDRPQHAYEGLGRRCGGVPRSHARLGSRCTSRETRGRASHAEASRRGVRPDGCSGTPLPGRSRP